MSEMRACYCGGHPEIIANGSYYIGCSTCQAKTPEFENSIAAIQVWNDMNARFDEDKTVFTLPVAVNENGNCDSKKLMYADGCLPCYISEVLVRINQLGSDEGDLYEIGEVWQDIKNGYYTLQINEPN